MTGVADTPTVLAGRYRLEREIGRGGMGAVYLALDLKHNRKVAVKMIGAGLGSAASVERFLSEINTAAQLNHPHILSVHDSGQAGGELYYVMPHVEGASLRERLDREPRLPITEALRIGYQVASALSYAHAHGVIHRDVKPENVLLDPRGHAYLMDFGLARALSTVTAGRLTAIGITVGSPSYMSPEQAAGESEVDGRSDIYSLGCLLFEMLVGQPPFTGPDAQSLLRQHLTQSPPSVKARRADIPPALERIVRTALAKAPDQRHASADQLARDLQGVLNASGASTSRRMVAEGILRRPRFAIPIATALLAGLAWAGYRAVRTENDLRAGILAAIGFGRPPALPATSIAILPFENLSPDHDLSALARGLTDDLIAELRRVPDLDVVSSAGVAGLRAGTVSLDSVAHALGVGTIITGGITRSGNRLRASVDVVDATSGRLRERVDVERDWDDLLPLRDSLVADVGFALRRAIGRDIRLTESRARTTSAEAWQLKQRAAELWDDFAPLVEAGDQRGAARIAEETDALLLRARQLDPDWLDPLIERARIADAMAMTPTTGPQDAVRLIARGIAFADSALHAAPDHARALEVRGALELDRAVLTSQLSDTAQLSSARGYLERAVRLDPTLAHAWSDLGTVHQYFGNPAAAALALHRAYEADAYIDNAGAILYRLFFLNYSLERDDEADRWCSEVARRSDVAWQPPLCRLMLLAAEPASRTDVATARELRGQALAGMGPAIAESMRPTFDVELAAVFARAGMADSAFAIIAALREQRSADPAWLAAKEASVLAALNRRDQAVAVLEVAVAEGLDLTPYFWNRQLKSLRDHPDFRRLAGEAPPTAALARP